MDIEIWSDIACPFCYIGKRNFETALAQFEHRDEVNVIWRSYQLMPQAQYDPNRNNLEALANHLGTTPERAQGMNDHVTQMAQNAGLTYHMDQLVWANTLDAHRLIHLAQEQNLGNSMKERLLKAHFTEGLNVQDADTLVNLAEEVGLEAEAVKTLLASDRYKKEVQDDIRTFNSLGLRGVPSYVIDRSSAFSGAVAPADSLKVLQKAYLNWKKSQPETIINGDSCGIDGCD